MLFVFVIYSTSEIAELRPVRLRPISSCSTDHTDRSIASDWLRDALDLDLIRMDHPLAPVPPFRFFDPFFLLLSFAVI